MTKKSYSRRSFLQVSGGMVATGVLSPLKPTEASLDREEDTPKIKTYRILGRTGFKVSDIGMGTGGLDDPNLVRYAYDKGVNYFDTAESYGNGNSERRIGEAMPHLKRENIFITTKLVLKSDETARSIISRFEKSLARMQTEYADCLYMHSIKEVKLINHAGFHQAVKQLKSEGRLRFAGISSHGPSKKTQDSMEKVLTTAAEDGRFDVMLFVYGFMNKEAGDKILEACKKNNVGTTAMKISPGFVKVDPFDPQNPTPEQQKLLKRMMERGTSEEKAVKRLKERTEKRMKELEEYKPFYEKYGVKTNEQLRKTTIRWVLGDERMHTICVSLRSFDLIDLVIPLSGTRLSAKDSEFLHRYGQIFNNSYCRHACNICQSVCPLEIPVSSIMRYTYYALMQGREKEALQKYAGLGNKNADNCLTCDGYCNAACPYGVEAQANLLQAHAVLTLV
ncbi:MAG TPA: hypothetical protein EYP36_01290 [Calditrichaeota bacterium]|nr:hypothetical protein [Calditrichota bacterium]